MEARPADPADKQYQTVRAIAARAGVELYELAEGGYLLTRWNMHRELPDLRAVVELLRRMGVAA